MGNRILTIVGARPQFIKASVVNLAIKKDGKVEEILLHTGQHYDANMSDIFFKDLGVPEPDINLEIHGGSHGQMTGRMLEKIEGVLITEKPDRVLIYGDTNSTLAGALAAVKLHIPVAHVEAGLRSFDRRMPEEINRILSDQISNVLFSPTLKAVKNLESEGIRHGKDKQVYNVGDVMQDAARVYSAQAHPPDVSGTLPADFILATFHRAENTDDIDRLNSIVSALNRIHGEIKVILPLHPRTRAAIAKAGLEIRAHVIEPTGYLEMLWLLQHCSLVATDSGGLQKESYFHGKPCVTLRQSTEWSELLDVNANVLVGADENRIVDVIRSRLGQEISNDQKLYGDGHAAGRIAEILGSRRND
ncbi:non-hydrolyzing UDP-N-acetylglucosamine 2-epimerase [Marimonas sp. MJW-29]|uniref:Non-hydrolyzing UDP-N-acetylglucosamine 2-epimerase n=1 Tax=Sulfitobacter sediminis TaxID=3234186 RepID=A0ABV3RN00_9RHOB